jgi:lipoprotein-anchoring transpeptidase ErfK/SrfK
VFSLAPAQAETGQLVRQFDPASNSWVMRRVDTAPLAGFSDKSPIPRRTVAFAGNLAPGTVVISTGERRLYYVLGGGRAIQSAIGVGREGFAWSGREKVSRKAEWPGWTPPAEMIEREAEKGHYLPAHMEGGRDNPLGARAIYLGDTLYRIHGTDQPWTIGKAVSSGCIRMANDDVIDLYGRIHIGTQVIVRR